MFNLRQHPLAIFFAGAFGISWLGMLPSILGPSGLGVFHSRLPNTFSIGSGNIVFPLWITVASFGPTLAALIAQKLCYGRVRGFRLWTSLRQILTGTIVGMLCVLLARWLLAALGLTRSGYTAWNWAALLNFRYYFIFSLVVGPIGEEPGWRGFALPILQSRYRQSPYGSARASLLLGLIWSSWHLPLFLIQGWTTSQFWIYAIIVTALSVIITLAYNLSGGSVITAILVHDTFNAGGAPLHDFLGNAILRQHFDLIVACAFLLTAMALTASTRGNLGMKCSAAADEDAA